MNNKLEIGEYRYDDLFKHNKDYFLVLDQLVKFNGLLNFFNVSYIRIEADPYDVVCVRVFGRDLVVLADIVVESDQSVNYFVENGFHFLYIK